MFRCDYDKCLQKISRSDNLKRHVDTVPDENNVFICCECDKKLTRKDALIRHFNIMHSDNSKSYNCEKCQKNFNRKDNLKRHMKTTNCAKLSKSLIQVRVDY